MPLRRLTLAAVAALAPVLFAAPAVAAPMPLPLPYEHGDHLTVTVTDSGSFDGTYDLYCHPAGGTHPRAKKACAQLDGQTRWGKDAFAPVPADAMCTMIYGGDQKARVTGTWAGRPVDARFDRTNGCEIARWNKFSELLGDLRSTPKG
ncbi:SSI family serine proteinase inhibitor [Streptomyces syringium]|uniref:SSI family serine proteinase inhibitor n=1 Tax=Streptomyces syringium TaxID=76729 RepID=UPI0033E905A3